MDFLLASASNTGGKAIVNTNDFEPGINQIFAENSSYYLIGYAAPSTNGPGSLHRRERARQPSRCGGSHSQRLRDAGSGARRAEQRRRPRRRRSHVAGPVASGDLPMRVALSPVAGPDGPVVTIVLGFTQPVGRRCGIAQTLELQTNAFTPDGRARGSQRHSAKVTIVAGRRG